MALCMAGTPMSALQGREIGVSADSGYSAASLLAQIGFVNCFETILHPMMGWDVSADGS